MPISFLSENKEIFDLTVYNYNQESGWQNVGINVEIETIDTVTYAVLTINNLKGVFFIGLMPEPKGVSNISNLTGFKSLRKRIPNPLNLDITDINCVKKEYLGELSYKTQICTIKGICANLSY